MPEGLPTPEPELAPTDNVPAAPPSQGGSGDEGFRAVFEQILVAFILAFIFRAFVLEAFVIPTGSMATTLLGAHMQFDCPDCGWDYTVNYPTNSGQDGIPPYASGRERTAEGIRLLPRTYSIRCPNCGYRLPRHDPLDPENDAHAPRVHHGDRILVLKHLYVVEEPDRWDVVVFKNPSRGGGAYGDTPGWSTEPYQQNYIKRLIGLPGDTLMLLRGDVYVTDAEKTREELEPEDFRIARKDPVAQSALWRVVYDDDHRPRGLPREYENASGVVSIEDPRWQLPWRPAGGDGWAAVPAGEGGGFRFEGEDRGVLAFDAGANPLNLGLTDFLTYNVTVEDQRYGRSKTTDTFENDFPLNALRDVTSDRRYVYRMNTASDLRLRAFYERLSGEGALRMRLSKRDHLFEAEFYEDRVRLLHVPPQGEPVYVAEARVDLAGGPHEVEMINADYRVRIRVDGETVIQTRDADYSPDITAILADELADEPETIPTVEFVAQGQTARLRHVSLWRDVYHTSRNQAGSFLGNRFGSPEDFPEKVLRLGEDEFFMLGDNPFLSGDARGWSDGLRLRYEDLAVEGGRVPRRFVLGRAFFVYWPASYSPGWGIPALVPNFGDMRFIR